MKSRIKKRLDEIVRQRLENLKPVSSPGMPEVPEDPWVIRSLRGETTVGKFGGVAIDVAVSFLPRWADRLIGIARKQTDRPMKKALRRALSTEGGSLIRVRDEDGNIDTTAIVATLIRVAIILGIYYAATWLGLSGSEILAS